MERTEAEAYLEASWRRSRQWGVDPHRAEAAVLTAEELRLRKEEHQALLRAVQPFVDRLYGWVRKLRATVIVSDPEGVILDSLGDPVFLREADKVHLKSGANWCESVKGTNAIGTALAERRAVAVIGSQHYCAAHHFLWCVASPVWSPSGELLGVMDVSGFRDEYHPASLALVETAARNVEDWWLLRNAGQALVLSLTREGGGGQALLAVNSEGHVVGANQEARTLLTDEPSTLVGRSVTHLLEEVQPLLDGNAEGKELYLPHRRGGMERWRASVLLDNRPRFFAFKRGQKQPPQGIHNAWPCRYTFADLCGNDSAFQAAIGIARRAAATDYNVLVYGETGTGKEMVAQAIHRASRRADKPFVAINCGAIPRNVMEAELFGYEPGAFTGAKPAGQPGKLELADGGTLFLDEIGDMHLDVQVALLRVLQERTVTRLGGLRSVPVDVRIIAATHKDLWQEVQAGRFRADLFFRLQGVTVELPPLRLRSDLLRLAEHMLEQVAAESGRERLTLTRESQAALLRYRWPGNVRELLAALRQAAFLASGEIRPEHLPAHIRENERRGEGVDSLRQVEREMIDRALKLTGGNVSQAARLLGIGRNTLYRKLAKWT